MLSKCCCPNVVVQCCHPNVPIIQGAGEQDDGRGAALLVTLQFTWFTVAPRFVGEADQLAALADVFFRLVYRNDEGVVKRGQSHFYSFRCSTSYPVGFSSCRECLWWYMND